MQDLSVKTNGITLHAVTTGEGPLVVFCHGFPGHWSSWTDQMNAVAAAGYKALALDMRGYGESSRPDAIADYSMDHQINDLLGLLTALGEQQAVFVGQDFGAPLVWNLAVRHPDKVAAVIGISIPFDHDYFGRSCLGHLSEEQLSKLPNNQLLVASPINPPSVGFKAIAEHQFLHAYYFQEEGVADKALSSNAREFLTRIYWGLSAKGSLGEWSDYPAEGTHYLDVLPKAPPLPWPWMSHQAMDTIEAAFLLAGPDKAFSGGLASYRVADINWQIGSQYAALDVTVPALFIAGKEDPVVQSVDEAALARVDQRMSDLRGVHFIPNAGHFVQMEKPKATSEKILQFLNTL